ncbi:uncharacterized protein Triagg1_10888 [Trichoderma aggressivum f. europaeum]|uniref:Uncharacterized protein n=1 Tax=Trichoderma aggressivum f. europaeum TaxID=173218 RepID=A0AAE1LZ98_9HYPO|nr:hypothetical protein Triagg1_10888 [Trichoderma aggressivum f. europaeum]
MAPQRCITQTDWFMGVPIPESEKPTDSDEGFFVAQPQTPPDQISEKTIKNWECSRYRLKFARLLDFDGVLRTASLLSRYLGFSTRQQFYYFVDFIVSYRRGHLKSLTVRNWANLDELVPVLTVIACMYKLIMSNLLRFMESTVGLENECVWDIHHEDWQRAYAVIAFVKTRRANFNRCPRAGSPKYTACRKFTPECFAYASPDVIDPVAARQGNVTDNSEE